MDRVTRHGREHRESHPDAQREGEALMPPDAAQNRMMAVRMVVMLQSKTARKAFLKPALGGRAVWSCPRPPRRAFARRSGRWHPLPSQA